MPPPIPALSAAQIDAFIADGFVHIDNAFSTDLVTEGGAIRHAVTDSSSPRTSGHGYIGMENRYFKSSKQFWNIQKR